MPQLPFDLAKRFWVDDMANATTAGTRLNNILASLEQGKPLTRISKSFLVERGLHVLANFANGEIDEAEFDKLARSERDARIAATLAHLRNSEARKQIDQAESKAREAAMWTSLDEERVKRESDPKFIAKQKSRELRRRFGVDVFVEEVDFKRLMAILHKLDSRARLSEEDAVWLRTEGSEYDSQEIQHAYNCVEADYFVAEFKRTGDIWNAVSASSHLRKCDASKDAHALLSAISDTRLKLAKLKSAVRTTHGGVLRDLGLYNEAMKFGEEAHSLLPNDFRPCTLLGALNIELGQIDTGLEWYRKAEMRGAPADSIDSELHSIIARMSAEKREEVTHQLLKANPVRYGWLLKKAADKGRSRV